jgi:acetate kinase
MSADLLLTFNAGSSSIKIGVFEIDRYSAHRLASGMIDFRKAPLKFHVTEGPAIFNVDLKTKSPEDLSEVLSETFGWLAKHFNIQHVTAVGHRVVHGGDTFGGPIRIDDSAIKGIDALTMLAPLHQPQCLRLIRAIQQLRPDVAQVASFDTAFHRTNAEVVRRFAIPRKLHDDGIKRYGFHGLSYKYIAGELARRAPGAAEGKVIVAHLGSGASLCGLNAGVSQDSSMGFSTLDGIPMATRCGALDPGVLLHLLGPLGRPMAEVETILYKNSGLLGVSGISADSRELLMSDRAEAREAIDLFTFRIAGEMARIAATLGGLDAIVFTAGIGEHQPLIRAGVSDRLSWLGLELDHVANAANAETISATSSRIAAYVIPTNEEQVIADEALSVLHETALAI